MIVATYLTFFPVTIAELRGLRSPDPRALELMRSLRRVALDDLLEAAPAGVAAVPVHRAQDRRDGEHRRRDHRRGQSGRQSGSASAGPSSTSTSSTPARRRSCGPRSSSPSLLGISFFLVVARRRAPRAARPARGRRRVSVDRERDRQRPPVVSVAGVEQGVRRARAAGTTARSRASTWRSGPASSSRSSGRRAAASRRCCASSATSTAPTVRHGHGQRQARPAGPPRSRLRDGLPGAGPVRLANGRGERRAAARDHGHGRRRARRRRVQAMLELVELGDFARPLPVPAVGRHAAARRDRAGARARAVASC